VFYAFDPLADGIDIRAAAPLVGRKQVLQSFLTDGAQQVSRIIYRGDYPGLTGRVPG
jgi:hypothetical protein